MDLTLRGKSTRRGLERRYTLVPRVVLLVPWNGVHCSLEGLLILWVVIW